MKAAFIILLGLSLSGVNIASAVAETNEERLSTQILRDPSPAIARRVSISGRLQWSNEDRNLYPTWAGTPAPRDYCLPVLINQKDDLTSEAAEKLSGKNVKIYGIISFVSSDADSISINSCKQLGIHVIHMEAVSDK